jgi:hypothetical protein
MVPHSQHVVSPVTPGGHCNAWHPLMHTAAMVQLALPFSHGTPLHMHAALLRTCAFHVPLTLVQHLQRHGENAVGCSRLVWNCCTPGVTAAMVSRHFCTARADTRALRQQSNETDALGCVYANIIVLAPTVSISMSTTSCCMMLLAAGCQ